MHNFKELKIWQRSRTLVKKVYQLTTLFPKSEQYGLTSQINRSSVSIISNIAEGAGRSTEQDFGRFLDIAIGSAFELETQLILSTDLGFIKDEKIEEIIKELNEIQKMIRGFKKNLSSIVYRLKF
jgi:four helix bundle protein